MTGRELCALLARGRFPLHREVATQAAIAQHLVGAGIAFERERRLGADRPDFMVEGGIAVEVKLAGEKRRIYDQLARYAQHDEVREVVLVTGRAMGVPVTIGGKPAWYLSLSRGWL